MSAVNRIAIIGAGLAGDTAAAALREAGFTGAITIVGDEPHRPYDRPPLSKAALTTPEAAAKVFFRDASWYSGRNIDLVLGDAAVAIDASAHRVTLQSGVAIAYDKLLLATGARARRLHLFEQSDAPLFYLRSLDDCAALRAILRPATPVAIVGAGVIGLEVAASAAALGCNVTVVELADRVMARSVSYSVSEFIAQYHREKGVRVICGTRISGITARGKATTIELESGERLDVEAIIAGVGAEPAVELARTAGLTVDDGILVDRYTRTNHPDIHAAGDVARFESLRNGRHVRAEHWRHAVDHARIAAQAMLGLDATYDEQPWVWSDQYDLNIQITGESSGDAEITRGRPEDSAFVAFQLREGRLVGAVSVNQPRFKKPIADLVAARPVVDAALLADTCTDLKKLAVSLLTK